MESRVNYTLIGLFVLLLGIAAVVIPLWLTSGLDQQHYQSYLINMNEAVDGLSVNAPVKYNGVNVGYVKKITLNNKNPQQVKIIVDIKQETPMTTNTQATLREQGITGVEYIGLDGGQLSGAKPLVVEKDQPYPIIKVSPSLKARLDSAIKQLIKNVNQVTKQLDLVVTPENTKLFHQSLENLNNFTAALNAETPQMKQSLNSFNTLMQNLNQSSQSLPLILNNLQGTSQNFQTLSLNLQQNPNIILQSSKPQFGPGETP